MPSHFESAYATSPPSRDEVNALSGVVVLEFGAPWCPICQGAQTNIQAALMQHDAIKHLKVEDGSGQPLGRSFRVKLWPTLVVMKDGLEIGRVVRPDTRDQIEVALPQSE